MKKLFAIIVAGILTGCAVAPTLDNNAIQQVRASLNRDEGAMKFSAVAIWVPNSKEFKFEAVEPFVKGIVVVTEQSILFQQWGGPTGLTTIKRIALADIQAETLITFGASARIVIRTSGDKYDSFAVSDGTGEVSIRAGTTDIYEVLVAQKAILKSRS